MVMAAVAAMVAAAVVVLVAVVAALEQSQGEAFHRRHAFACKTELTDPATNIMYGTHAT